MAKTELGIFTSLLDATFALLPRTWKTSLLWSGVLFVPPVVVGSLAAASPAANAAAGSFNPATSILLSLLALVLHAFAAIFVRASVTELTLRSARGESPSSFDAASAVARRMLPSLIGQRVLVALILIGTSVGAALILSAGMAITVASGVDALAPPLILLVTAAWISVAVLFLVRYSFSLQYIVAEGAKAPQSFMSSAALVRGSWWRIFSYRALFVVMMGFGMSLIITPVAFFSIVPTLVKLARAYVAAPHDAEVLQKALAAVGPGLWFELGIIRYVSSVLSAFVGPVFAALLFAEMKKRNALIEPAVAVSIGPEVSAADAGAPTEAGAGTGGTPTDPEAGP